MKLFHRSQPVEGEIDLTDPAPPDDGLEIIHRDRAYQDGKVIVLPEARQPAGDLSVIVHEGTEELPTEEAVPALEGPRPGPLRRGRLAFRRWRRTRPFWGGFWTVLAGFQIAYGPATAYKLMFVTNSVWIGVSVGVFIFAMGLFVWFAPRQQHLYGLVIVIASLVSLLTSDLGGFLVGMLLGIIGGSMAFAWTPIDPAATGRRHRRRRKQATDRDAVPA